MQEYRKHVPRVADALRGGDPEVVLAVRVGARAAPHGDDLDEDEDEDEDDEENVDAFVSSHGFEYVDGERGARSPTNDNENLDDEDDSGACVFCI